MADKTGIEWTDATWNPTTGCDRTSPGCDNCYALKQAGRLKQMGSAKYQNDGNPNTSGPGFKLTVHPATLNDPKRWTRARMIFVDSMSDLFHKDVGDSFIQQVFDTIVDTPRHTYQILTKRSRRLAQLANQLPWPENLWIGVSVETDKYLYRLKHLNQTPAKTRFISAEPLLGPLTGIDLTGIDWVIAGGESGDNARPVQPDWVRQLRDTCTATGTPFFFKQWGGRTPKQNGATLDGATHTEHPRVETPHTEPPRTDTNAATAGADSVPDPKKARP